MPNDPVHDIAQALEQAKLWNEAPIALARHGARAGMSPKNIATWLGRLAAVWPHWPDPELIAEIVRSAVEAAPQPTKKDHTP